MASFVAGVLLAPRLLSQEVRTTNGFNFDYNALEHLSGTTGKGSYEIKMIKEAEEKELVDAWVSKFWELQECPSCSGKVLETGICEGCEKIYLD